MKTANITPNPKVTVESQGHFFRLRITGTSTGEIVGGPRGTVCGFSRQSRKRMLELLARVDVERAGFVAFVTLTYPDGDGPPLPLKTDRDRQAFLKRISRAYPEASAIWRREWEPRKSGEFKGGFFPHYHLLFFGLPFVHHEKLNAIWASVIDCHDYVRTEIKGIQSWRQAFYYVAKYMAKPVQVDGFTNASRCPTGRKSDSAAVGEVDSSLVYGAYLTAKEKEPERKSGESLSIGRSWGVFSRKALPMASKRVAMLDYGKWIRDARRLGKMQWEGVGDYPGCGFSLFVENADEWSQCMSALVKLHHNGTIPENTNVLNPVRGMAK